MKMNYSPKLIQRTLIVLLLIVGVVGANRTDLMADTIIRDMGISPIITLPIKPIPTGIYKLPLINGSDLIPTALFFDSGNVLNVTFKNEGNLEVPEGVGSLSIFIDGKAVGGYSLSYLANQSFRNPGGSTTIRTNFRMSGSNRRIAVVVDSGYEIRELNEFQNTLSRTMTPPALTGPDFIIGDLSLDTGSNLIITVKNIGNAASLSNLAVRMRVIVNESVAADLTPSLPALAANGGWTVITPNPAIPVNPDSKVRVLLNTNNLYDELDDTNNVREEMLPNGYSLAAYNTLLALPLIQNNMVWRNGNGDRNYGAWSASERNDLMNVISTLENGEPLPVIAPPAVNSNGYISAGDAWQIYLSYIAQSLWAEVHQVVPWSLLNFTDSQLVWLLDGRKLITYISTTNQYLFYYKVGECTAWNPKISYEFLSNLGLVQDSQMDTVYALTNWMRAHLQHMGSPNNNMDQYGYAGPAPADKILYPLEGKGYVTTGCWCTSGLYAAVLRSVNIPVEQAIINFGGTHSRTAFPTIDRGLAHGDDPYNIYLVPSGGAAPIDRIFYTYAEINDLFVNPILDTANGITNTIGEQASYNKGKNTLQLAYDYMTDGLLVEYAQYGPVYLNDSLRGPRIGGGVREYAKPYFTDAERAAMVTAVENKIMAIGDGDLTTGKNKVIERFNRFLQHK